MKFWRFRYRINGRRMVLCVPSSNVMHAVVMLVVHSSQQALKLVHHLFYVTALFLLFFELLCLTYRVNLRHFVQLVSYKRETRSIITDIAVDSLGEGCGVFTSIWRYFENDLSCCFGAARTIIKKQRVSPLSRPFDGQRLPPWRVLMGNPLPIDRQDSRLSQHSEWVAPVGLRQNAP